MDIMQIAMNNTAVIMAFEATKKPKAYTPPHSVVIAPHGKNQWTWSSKLENQRALYEAADRAEPGTADIQILEGGIAIYRLRRSEHEALRNPETRHATALKIKAELDAQRQPSAAPRVSRR